MGQSESRGDVLKIITFYADCYLPENAQRKQDGFDWRGAIAMLSKSGARFGYEVLAVTDQHTEIDSPWLRYGDAKKEGLMMWLLNAQAAAIAEFAGDKAVMVSPDTLITRKLDILFGEWDVTLLTRKKPKPIVNSVIAFRPSAALSDLWRDVAAAAESLPADSKLWGADIDALVGAMNIKPLENCARMVKGVRAKFLPISGVFESVSLTGNPNMLKAPLWDFKGARKSLMPQYARLLDAHY